jgi:hypothetical protein
MNFAVDVRAPCPWVGLTSLTNARAGTGLPLVATVSARLVQVEADGNAIAGISAVEQIISVPVVVHVDVIVIVPIV